MRALILNACIWRSAASASLTLAIALFGVASAQDIPRTMDGRPDFQGTWSADFVPLLVERMPSASGLIVGDAEAERLAKEFWTQRRATTLNSDNLDLGMGAKLPRVNGQWRSSHVTEPIDGKVPLTPLGIEVRNAGRQRRDAVGDGPESRPETERCVIGTSGPPLLTYPTDNLRQFVQTRDHLVISSETISSDVRIIGINAAKRPAALSSYVGDSTARWDGDVLVIETSGMRALGLVQPGIIITGEAKVIERLSLLTPNELLYRYTIEDPKVFSQGWTAEYSMKRSSARMYETACHEGNYTMTYILLGARETRRRASR